MPNDTGNGAGRTGAGSPGPRLRQSHSEDVIFKVTANRDGFGYPREYRWPVHGKIRGAGRSCADKTAPWVNDMEIPN